MPVCSICAETCEDSTGVQRHEWLKHREAYLANKPTWHVRYKAPAADLPFCALCELFIGREAIFSHLSNPGHLARSSSSSVGQSPHVSQAQAAEMSTSGGDLWEEPTSFSRRPRARLASNADDSGREEDAPRQEEDAPQQAEDAPLQEEDLLDGWSSPRDDWLGLNHDLPFHKSPWVGEVIISAIDLKRPTYVLSSSAVEDPAGAKSAPASLVKWRDFRRLRIIDVNGTVWVSMFDPVDLIASSHSCNHAERYRV